MEKVKKINFIFLYAVIIFLPFAALLGNILEFKTAMSSSQVFWIMHWYEIVLPIVLIPGIYSAVKDKKIIDQPFLVATILVIYSLVMVFSSGNLSRSLEGFRFTVLPVVFFILASSFDSDTKKKFLSSLTTYYLLLATFVALWAIIERFLPAKYWNTGGLIGPNVIFGWGWHSAGGFLQSTSFLGGPNQLGSYLLPVLFLAVCRIQNTDNSKTAYKTVYCLLSTVISLAIVLSLSRSAILGMFVGLVVYLLYFNRKKFLTYTVSSMFIVAIFLIWLFASNTNLNKIITHGGQTGHTTAFTETITEIKNRTAQKPFELVFGSGLGTAGPLAIKYGNGLISESWYLQLLLEVGVVGLLLWLWFIISLSKELLEENERGLFLGLLAVSFAAIFLHTWADNPALSYSLFILLGIARGEKWQKEY